MRGRIFVLAGLGLLALGFAWTEATRRVDERTMPDGSAIQNSSDRVAYFGRPTDIAWLSETLVAAKDERGLAVFDVPGRKLLGRFDIGGAASALGLAPDGSKGIWITNSVGDLIRIDVSSPSEPKQDRKISLGGKDPCGLCLNRERTKAYVALSASNSIACVDLVQGAVIRTIPCGVAPFSLALDETANRLFVAEQGVAPLVAGSESAVSAGTPVAVDERGLSVGGAVSTVSLETGAVTDRREVGRQPQQVLWDPIRQRVWVTCSNDDTIMSFDPKVAGLTKTSVLKGLWGAQPAGMALQNDTLLVTLAGRNEVRRYRVEERGRLVPLDAIKTDWYPVAIAVLQDQIVVANLKGLGSRMSKRSPAEGRNSYDYKGTIQFGKASQFQRLAIDRASESAEHLPPIHHVVYVIKENRTFDQVFGDMSSADADPNLCVYGEEITPNQHAIAKQFVTLDNYYCSGVLSADGHSWATEGNVTPYLERSFGGFPRSYTFGDDPLTYSGSGFLWDPLLAKGLTFRNYGEFDYASPKPGEEGGMRLYQRSLKPGARLDLNHSIGVRRVRELSNPDYPGWNMDITDQYRINVFEAELRQFVKKGSFPSLTVVYLPQDHTGGPASPRSHVADNDLAVGRLVDLLSHTAFWKDMVIFVNEDDPQAGFDHVDGHRSTCLVAGPFVKRKQVVSNFFSQASVLRTIDQIFGLPPLNSKVAQAPSMAACFTNVCDPSPFSQVPARVPLDESPAKSSLYAQLIPHLKLSRHEVQTKEEMDALNRAIWQAAKGNVRYPSELAGAHGKGLRARGLSPESEISQDD